VGQGAIEQGALNVRREVVTVPTRGTVAVNEVGLSDQAGEERSPYPGSRLGNSLSV
jgi:hypothetical protein